MKKYAIGLICLFISLTLKAQYSVSSPDGKVWVTLRVGMKRNLTTKVMRPKWMKMDVTLNGNDVITKREIGLDVYSHGRRYSFGKLDMARYTRSTVSVTEQNDGLLAQFGDRCNCLLLESDHGIVLELMVFNTAVAYRFSIKGMEDEYKILNVCDAFPNDEAHAILGTFTGDLVLPWCTMRLDGEPEEEAVAEEWQTNYPANKIVSWKDALSSVSIGFTTNWIAGKAWRDVSQSHGVYADFIYKHLYGGLSFTPCHELLFLNWDKDFEPFKGVMGSVRSWDMSGRLGYNLPIQFGRSVWCFSPYATATYLKLHQHGKIHPLATELKSKNHTLIGLGLKVQYMMRERFSFGAGYEFGWFTGKHEPIGRSTLVFTIGYGL